jgi:hypothetical protein
VARTMSHLISAVRTLAVYLLALSLAVYVTTAVSMAWGAFLFLVLAVFVGIPLSGTDPRRPLRMALFVLAMVFFSPYAIWALRYDMFAGPVPFSAQRCADRDFNIQSGDLTSYWRPPTYEFYRCFFNNDGTYLLVLQGGFPESQQIEGYFIKGTDAEKDSVLLDGFLRNGESPDDIRFGFFQPDGKPGLSMLYRQNRMFLLFVSLFGLGFVLEELYFLCKIRRSPD